MENERTANLVSAQDQLFEFHYQAMLSELWIGRFYEHLRLLIDRDLLPKTGDIGALAEDFRLLRVPIEKHEITSQGQLAAPLQTQRRPTEGKELDLYLYDKKDPKRAHIMPRSVSQRGSLMSQVIDLKNDEERWIERLTLSERIITLWGADNTPSKPAVT
jgi:hypothetical protein